MTNIQPKGVDKVTGQDRPIEITDVRTTALGQWLDIPTPGKWGSNTETLSAALTLTDLSPALQRIDGGTADRDINLPTLATTNPVFTIINNGLTVLTILHGATAVGYLFPDNSATVYSNGSTAWFATGEGQSIQKLGQVYNWGGNASAGNFLHIWGSTSTTAVDRANSDDVGVFHIAAEAGTISEVSWVQATAGDYVLKLYIDDVAETEDIQAGAISGLEAGTYRFRTPISVSAGARLSIEDDTPGGEWQVAVTVRSAAPVVGYWMGFAGDPNAGTTIYYKVSQAATDASGKTSDDWQTGYKAVGTGNITKLAWTSIAGGGSDGHAGGGDTVTATGGRTFTFANPTNPTVTASTGSFLTDNFGPSNILKVTGTTSNNGNYTISGVTALVITLDATETLVAEGPLSSLATLQSTATVRVEVAGTPTVVNLTEAGQTGGTGNAWYRLETTSIAFTEGDIISVYGLNADYGDATITLHTDVIGQAFYLSGDPANNSGLDCWSMGTVGNTAMTSTRTWIRCDRSGRVYIGYRAQSTITGPFQLFKNGIVTETLAYTGTAGNIATGTYVEDGDILQIKTDGSGGGLPTLLVIK